MNKVELSSLKREDIDEALELLAASFCNEPMFKYIFQKENIGIEKAKSFFAMVLRLANINKNVITLEKGGKLIGIMFYYPPRYDYSTFKGILEAFRFMLKSGLSSVKRMLNLVFESDKQFSYLFHSNYYILHYIAIHKDYRKQGYSKVLLDFMREKARCHMDCSGVVLEAGDSLIDYYKRHGYAVKKRVAYCGQEINFMYLNF